MSGGGPSPCWGGIAAGGCGVAGSGSTILWSGTTEQGCGLREEWRRYKICVVSLLFSNAALHSEFWLSACCSCDQLHTFTKLSDRTIARVKLDCDMA